MSATAQDSGPVLLAVNVGQPKDLDGPGGRARTAIWKAPVSGRRRVGQLNVDGDRQADLVGHGGPHRAVLVYQVESYRFWEGELGRELPGTGVFGENFTVAGLSDGEVRIGDRYRVGSALFEVSQPRVTCFKVGLRLGEPRMPALLIAAGRPGFYLRVLQEGDVGAGDPVLLVDTDPAALTVVEVDALLYRPGRSPADLERALAMPALPRGWKDSLQALLDGSRDDAAGRAAPAWPGLRPFTVHARSAESSDVQSFELVPQDAAPLPAYLPGQFVTVAVPGFGGQGDLTASYSLSQGARPDRLRISVKRSRAGSAGRRLHDEVAAGDPVRVAAPRGTFTLDVAATGPVVLLSAGVGVTPVLAMLDALAAGASRRPVWWVHVARNSSEHPHAAQAQAMLDRLPAAHRHLRYTRPLPTDRLGVDFDATGRLGAGDLAALDLPVEADCYVCGPPGFLTDVSTALRAQGRQPGRVHVEGFGAPAGDRPDPHPPATTGSGPQVVFARSGLTVRWPDGPATLLELAESCDVPADWSCRTGVCHRCQTPLVDGSVTYDPEPIDPPADGTVLICCSRPAADLVLDL